MLRPRHAHVKTGLELGRIEDKCQWDWGALAIEIAPGDETEDLQAFAIRVARNYKSLLEYRRVSRVFPLSTRVARSWHHHQAVATIKDPAKRHPTRHAR